jgi:hypothetical protein
MSRYSEYSTSELNDIADSASSYAQIGRMLARQGGTEAEQREAAALTENAATVQRDAESALRRRR